MFFVFSRFWFFWPSGQDSSVQARSIYLNLVLFERARRDEEHYRVLFLIKLCFLLGVPTQTLIFGAFFESFNLWAPFSAKKIRILKKGLYSARHPDMLFLTKKNLNILNEPGPRNLGQKMSYFWPLFGSYLCQKSVYRAENFITHVLSQVQHILQISARFDVPGLRSIFEGRGLN